MVRRSGAHLAAAAATAVIACAVAQDPSKWAPRSLALPRCRGRRVAAAPPFGSAIYSLSRIDIPDTAYGPVLQGYDMVSYFSLSPSENGVMGQQR